MANYLYNGVELPEFPEQVKKEYPYLVIGGWNSGGYWLYCSLTPSTVYSTDSEMTGFSSFEFTSGASYRYNETDASWELKYTNEGQRSIDSFGTWDIVWTNHDVLISGMTDIYRAKSPEPVPVLSIDHTAMVQGWIVGKRLAAMRGKKEPVAYLYNGVRLPKLPEWDKEKYPYAILYIIEWGGTLGTGINIRCSNTNKYVYDGEQGISGNLISRVVTTEIETGIDFKLDDSGSRWNQPFEETTNATGFAVFGVVWANFDILNADGSTYLAASDPVPVYE